MIIKAERDHKFIFQFFVLIFFIFLKLSLFPIWKEERDQIKNKPTLSVSLSAHHHHQTQARLLYSQNLWDHNRTTFSFWNCGKNNKKRTRRTAKWKKMFIMTTSRSWTLIFFSLLLLFCNFFSFFMNYIFIYIAFIIMTFFTFSFSIWEGIIEKLNWRVFFFYCLCQLHSLGIWTPIYTMILNSFCVRTYTFRSHIVKSLKGAEQRSRCSCRHKHTHTT